MKSLKLDNRMIYETLAKNNVFVKCEEDGLKLVGDGGNGARAGMVEARFIGTVGDEKVAEVEEEKDGKDGKFIFNDARLEFLSRLAVPALGFFIFWKVHKLQSIDVL
jgi:hypothetical protein